MASLIKSRAKSNSIYDFPIVVSIDGVSKKLSIREYFQTTGLNQLPKALLISNMKEDDPSSRLSIPQFIDLTTEFPSLCVILIPTDQGYFEPDTSDLIRAKLNKEYGFGGYGKDNNKNSKYQQQVVTDKIDWLGKPSLEFVTGWLEDVLPSPTDNSRGVRGNYEKFLVDGRSGLPVRRYPKGYEPRLIGKDLKTLLGGNDFDFDEGLGPASSDWLEWWRMEIESSKSDTYRFQKGLNYFDY